VTRRDRVGGVAARSATVRRVNTFRPAWMLAALVGTSVLAGVAPGTAVVAAARPAAKGAATSAMVVPWIADDYTRAVAEAKARKVPLFIEAWAPW
jgi:hypothetical protein